MVQTLPMFPLGTVLFPTMLLPLRVFEPRYHALVRRCVQDRTEPEFGVVLIERGSEVGGGDRRSNAGTVARILEVREGGAQLALTTIGTRRLRVHRWLEDDPFPLAEVEDDPDDAEPEGLSDLARSAVSALRSLLARATEAGYPVAPATTELSDDPLVASYQAAAIAPFGPHDHQRLLVARGPAERYRLLHELVQEQRAVLDALSSGGDATEP